MFSLSEPSKPLRNNSRYENHDTIFHRYHPDHIVANRVGFWGLESLPDMHVNVFCHVLCCSFVSALSLKCMASWFFCEERDMEIARHRREKASAFFVQFHALEIVCLRLWFS